MYPNERLLEEDEDGDTKVHFAAAFGDHRKLLKYLKVSAINRINSPNKLGWTPLMHACRNGHLPCATYLIQSGADVSYKNKFGVCSLSLAASSGNVQIVHLVLKNFLLQTKLTIPELEKSISPAVFSILFNCVDVLRYFIDNSFDLRRTNFLGGVSSIQFAAFLNNKEIMSLMNRRGLTPLSINLTTSSSRTNSVCNSPFLIPATPSPIARCSSFIVPQSPSIFEISSPHILKTPHSARNFISPRLSPKMARRRRCSNISDISMHTPSLSPISINNNSSLFLEGTPSSLIKSACNKVLNQRFSISPHRLRFSSNSSTDSTNSGNFLKPIMKKRNLSFYVPATPNVTPTKLEDDDVFVPLPPNKRNDEFLDVLTRHSLHDCFKLFEKHEIDLDLFVTLTKNDLEEIGVAWDKLDALLELIQQFNIKH